MPVFDYAGQNNDKVWLKYSYEYRVYWSHIPQVSLVRGPHHLASSEVDASTQKIDLTDVVNGKGYIPVQAPCFHYVIFFQIYPITHKWSGKQYCTRCQFNQT